MPYAKLRNPSKSSAIRYAPSLEPASRRELHTCRPARVRARSWRGYFCVWMLQRGESRWLIDTGFAQEAADRRKRELLRNPADALPLIGLHAEQITDVILTHLHYDHALTVISTAGFPNARFHLQGIARWRMRPGAAVCATRCCGIRSISADILKDGGACIQRPGCVS